MTHEVGLTKSILDSVLEKADENKAKTVEGIWLTVGQLALISEKELGFWFRRLSEGTIAAKAKLRIKFEKGLVECSDCGYKGSIKTERHTHIVLCPKCGSADLKIKQGKDVIIDKITVKT